MKNFVKRIIIFALPLLGVIFSIEYYLEHYPSTFLNKAKFIENNRDSINVLILGSSHNQAAFDIEQFEFTKAANIAFGNQSLTLDSLLLQKYIKVLPQLKNVVFEVAYHTLELETKENYHRNNLYLRFYNVNPFKRPIKLTDYSIFLSNPTLYLDLLNPWKDKLKVNKFGYLIENPKVLTSNYRFNLLDFDSTIILKDTGNLFIQRHRVVNLEAYNRNIKTLESMIELCVNNDVKPIIVSPPVYKNYYSMMLDDKEQRRKNFIKYLSVKYPLLNIYDSNLRPTNFPVTYFRNEDHLNRSGAKKYTSEFEKYLTLL